MLIPLVENGFKHGIKAATDHAFIHIFAEIEGNDFHFNVKNNKGEIDEIETDQFKGIGLKNVQRRLELLYPKKHQLNIQETNTTFEIDLKIDFPNDKLHHS